MKSLYLLASVAAFVIVACGSAEISDSGKGAIALTAITLTETTSVAQSAPTTSPPAPTTTLPVPAVTEDSGTRPSATASPQTPRSTVTPNGCYDRGFGGRITDADDKDVTVYFLVEPPEDPANAARAIAETLCAFGGTFVPPGELRVEKVDYTLRQLQDWYKVMTQHVWPREGIYTSGVSLSNNRIQYQVTTELAKQKTEEQIVIAGVPLEAVIIEVREQIGLDDPPVHERAEIGAELSISFASRAALGEQFEFTLELTNTSNQIIEIDHGPPGDRDVVILTADGRQIWRHQPPIWLLRGRITFISPGEIVEISVIWDGLDQDGLEIPNGDYLVRGFFNFSHSLDGKVAREKLNTPPQQLRLVRDLPD